MIFLFNWLVSPCFFLLLRILSEKKTHRGSSRGVSPFSSFPYTAFRTHPSLSYTFSVIASSSSSSSSLSLPYPLTCSTSPSALLTMRRSPFVRSAVQSCSKSRVCSCWSSSIFPRLLDPSILSRRFSQDRERGQSRGRTKTDGRGQGKLRPVLPQR